MPKSRTYTAELSVSVGNFTLVIHILGKYLKCN